MSYFETLKSRFTATWEQGVLTPRDQIILALAFSLEAFVRGIDYLTFEVGWGSEGHFLTDADGNLMQETLGIVLVLASLFVLFGIVLDHHITVWTGHAFLALSYFVASVSVTYSVFAHLATDTVQDSLRVPGTLWVAFWFHLFIVFRMGVDPLDLDRHNNSVEVSDVLVEPRKGKHSG